MIRSLLILLAPAFLCSCGVYQAIRDDDATQGYSGFALLNPITAVTGELPDTTAEDFKPISYYADLISGRNQGEMDPVRAKDISTAMDLCFGNKDIKKMTERKAIALFGLPDEIKSQSGWTSLVYRIQGGKYGERWLTLQ